MSRLHTSFVLGYHGCDRQVGEKILSGEIQFRRSEEDYDWLGPGVYFWEADPKRAFEWAREKTEQGSYNEPFAVGAVIDLGNCLDLMSRDSLDLLKESYESLVATRKKAGMARLPSNTGKPPDRVLRRRDCAVISHLHEAILDAGDEPFDTVRGLFTEGKPTYPGAGFQEKTHVQIAVCTLAVIKGTFRVAEIEYT